MCGSNIQAGGKNINDMTGFPTDTAFFCLAFASSVCKDERGTGLELIFKVYNSKRYGMSESKGLINFATDITNKKSEELSE